MVKAWGYTGRYLICRNHFLRAGCSCEAIYYQEVEATFLQFLRQEVLISSALSGQQSGVWLQRIKDIVQTPNHVDKFELNRLIRNEFSTVKIFHDTGQLEIHWKDKNITKLSNASTPSHKKSVMGMKRFEKIMAPEVQHVV